MPAIDFVVRSEVPKSVRVKQLSAMFDAPIQAKLEHHWKLNLPIEDRDWQIGLIVGPSGSGKTQIASRLWPEALARQPAWDARPVIDNFAAGMSVKAITEACMAVGFNTIPSWAKPYAVLSNGEKFRVDLARLLSEGNDLIVVDEFTSVVDRQVAKIGSNAVQKFVRRAPGKQFVALSCHYDVAEWLQPDWILDMSGPKFDWGLVRRRPDIHTTISPVPYAAWSMFAPFHYLTAELHRAARCFCCFVDGQPAAMAAMLHRAGRFESPIMACSRLVTLPDYQGIGLAMHLIDTVASIYSAVGKKVHTYPAHPGLIRSFDRSPQWAMRKRPGEFASGKSQAWSGESHQQGGRPCAVFRYVGQPAESAVAKRVMEFWS